MIRDNAAQLRKLRKLVREYLTATRDVPKRAVDCDQERVDQLEAELIKNTGWRDPYAKVRT